MNVRGLTAPLSLLVTMSTAAWTLILLELVPAAAWAAEASALAYVTADPASSAWMVLATLDGRYAIQLGDGCDGVVEGVNVLVTSTDAWPHAAGG
jgi:hypothetical protein